MTSWDVALIWAILASAHCIGDYPMQSEFLSKYKSKNCFVLVVHCVIYTAFICIGFSLALYLYNRSLTNEALMVLFYYILITHVVIDTVKCLFRNYLYKKNEDGTEYVNVKDKKKREEADVWGYYIDQVAHFVVLILPYFLIFQFV